MCTRFEDNGIVCPSNLRNYLFTSGALDNIDHSHQSSTTAQGFSFQLLITMGSAEIRLLSYQRNLSEYSLPDSYTNVPAVTCKTNELALECTEFNGCLELAKAAEKNWTESAEPLLVKDNDYVSWAAFHAATQSDPEECSFTFIF